MSIDRRALLAGASLTLASTAFPAGLLAQAFKGGGRIFAGFPAGGTLDQTARRLAEAIRPDYPDGLIVENRVGAGGRLAVDAIKAAAPDGLSLLVSPDSMMTIYPSYYRKLSYNPAADVAPVSAFTTLPYGFAVSAKVPASVKTLKEFVDWCKKNPTEAAYGHPGAGSSPHFAGAEFNRVSGAGMRHVPYRGSAPAVQDILGGHIASAMLPLGDLLQFIGTEKTRLIAVSSPKPSSFAPGIATFEQQGFKEVTAVETYGVFLPGKADMKLRERFAAVIRKQAADKAIVDAFAKIGMQVTPMTPAEYSDYLEKQRAKWAPIVKASGFSSDE